MRELLMFAALFAAWFLLQRFVLPWFGVET